MNNPNWTLQFITSTDQALLWMQIVFLWVLINYLIGADPAGKKATLELSQTQKSRLKRNICIRSLCFAIISLFLSGISTEHIWRRLLISIVAGLFALALPLIRMRLVVSNSKKMNSYVAEWELLANATLIISMAFLISTMNVHIKVDQVLFQIAASSKHIAAILAVASGLIFIVRGGTQVVRGILDKFEAVPKLKTDLTELAVNETAKESNPELQIATQDDTREYNRGRMIGNLERILSLLVILVGNYEALGFLVAGKGLIRAKEFEDRDFAEYFLLGTLTSTGLALIVGLVLHIALKWLW